MNKSESIKELAGALIAFQKEVGGVTKDGTNPHFRSKFATLDNVIATIKAPLIKNGLTFVQFPDGSGLTTIIMHKSGEWISSTADLLLDKQTPQGQGSAYTYGRRYALASAFGLATEIDDDGNAASAPKQHYDNTPIEENAPVTVTGGDDINEIVPGKTVRATAPKRTPAKSVNEQKKEIKDLVDLIVMNPLETGDEYKYYVKEQTGLELIAPNFPQIIERLKALN